MKKVMLIDYFFPPLAADWRGIAFVKYLPELGWQPIVISAAETVSYEKDFSLLQEIPESTEVYRVGHREPSRLWQVIRKKLRIAVDYPDYFKSWYRIGCSEARKVLKTQKVDLVYSHSPTFTTAFVAMQIKKEFSIPWIADFMDAWFINDYLHSNYNQILLKPLRQLQMLRIRRGERDIVKMADRVIVIHRYLKRQLSQDHDIKEEKIEFIPDGYFESDFTELKPRTLYPDKITIIFLGGAYSGFRDIALNFLQTLNEIDKDIETVFMGRGATAMEKTGIPNLTLISHLPRKKALAFGLGSDFLFLVTLPSAKWHTPTKLYDYLRLGKPIIALVPEDGDAARIIREAKAGFILPYEPKAMKQQLKIIFDKCRKGELKDFQPNKEYVAQFERRELTKRITKVLNEVSQ